MNTDGHMGGSLKFSGVRSFAGNDDVNLRVKYSRKER